MTAPSERAFTRLVRCYPRGWRRRHGAVVMATLLDAAEADGRTSPTAAEVADAILHGTAARMERTFAIAVAVAAAGIAVVVGVLTTAGAGGPLVPLLGAGATPLLAGWSLVATARVRGLLGDAQALLLSALVMLTCVLNAAAWLAWSASFDAADEGRPIEGLAAAWVSLVVAAIVVGAASIGLVLDAALKRATRLRAGARGAVAGAVGIAVAPILGVSTLSPVVVAAAACTAVALAVLPARRRLSDPRPQPWPAVSPRAGSTRPLDHRRAVAVRRLAWLAVGGSALGTVYAFTGAGWSAGATDGTVAMGHGITLLLLSALPLLAAVGLRAAAPPSRVRPRDRWAPLVLVALGTCIVGLAYVGAPDFGTMQPGFQAAAVLTGAGVAWAIIARAPLPRAAAITVGVSTGALYAAFVGVMVAPMLAFAVPVAAIIAALVPRWPRTRRREDARHPQPVSAA